MDDREIPQSRPKLSKIARRMAIAWILVFVFWATVGVILVVMVLA